MFYIRTTQVLLRLYSIGSHIVEVSLISLNVTTERLLTDWPLGKSGCPKQAQRAIRRTDVPAGIRFRRRDRGETRQGGG